MLLGGLIEVMTGRSERMSIFPLTSMRALVLTWRVCIPSGVPGATVALIRVAQTIGSVNYLYTFYPQLGGSVPRGADGNRWPYRRRPARVTGRQPNARVAVGLDAGRFWELVVAAVAALG